MPDVKIVVRQEDLRKITRNLRDDDLLAVPFRESMDGIREAGERALKAGAPRGPRGQLGAKLYGRMSAKPVPTWVAFRSRARRKSAKYPRGYGYPKRLEYDPKSRHRGWMKRTVAGLSGRVSAALAAAARGIEGRWGR